MLPPPPGDQCVTEVAEHCLAKMAAWPIPERLATLILWLGSTEKQVMTTRDYISLWKHFPTGNVNPEKECSRNVCEVKCHLFKKKNYKRARCCFIRYFP